MGVSACLNLSWGGPGRKFSRSETREPHPFFVKWEGSHAEVFDALRRRGSDGFCPRDFLPDFLADPNILAGNP